MGFKFFHIEFIWGFILIGVLLVLLFLVLRWKKAVKKKMGDARLIDYIIGTYSPKLFLFKIILGILAVGLGVLTIMDLRKPGAGEGIARKGIDVVVAIDVSKSMLATDLAPSRLDRAKQLVFKLMDDMPNDRIGLVLFAGQAYLQMPLTTDLGAAKMFVSSASPDAVPAQGTMISDALEMSSRAFNPKERRFKAVVLISDGEDHDEEALKKLKEFSAQGMMINTVGIGSPEGSYIPDLVNGGNKKDANGADIISKLNEDELKQIASGTNGVYVRLESADDAVKTIKAQLSQIESKAYGDVSLMNFNAYYWWFGAGMLVLLIVEFLLPETRKVKA